MLSAQQVQEIIRQGVPQAEDLDLRIEEVSDQHSLARIPFHSRLIRPGGTLSGPTLMALGDAAMYALVLGKLGPTDRGPTDRGPTEMAVTSNLNINFLSKPQPVDLMAKAKLLRMTRRQAVCEVALYSAGNEDELVAHVTGTYALPL
ncbi:MAG: PaaI family thioesterase [Halopseudomonas sabulinigri]|tara:strand:+ start:63222 stop:63662 length:441 start_codon:yes stop_codon:yes gene_type:complete